MNEIEVRSGLTGALEPAGHLSGFPLINHTGLSDTLVLESGDMDKLSRELASWVNSARAAASRGLFERGAYVPPSNPYDELRAARRAMSEDDIVGGIADVSESYAFTIVKWEGVNAEEADIFNQWNADVNMDDFLRMAWREDFAASQFVVGMEWDYRRYKPRGRTKAGNAKKKVYEIYVPTRLSILDTASVVPIAHSPMGDTHLGWCSTEGEVNFWARSSQQVEDDPLMSQFFMGLYKPSLKEEAELAGYGIDTQNILYMNPDMVWRHTRTKQSYLRFSEVRIKSVFKFLDLKQQKMNSDRALLIGSANYILLVKKGTDEFPAKQQEVDHLKENFNFVAKLPVIVSDHRLEVEIIAPKMDFALKQESYDLIDTRILMRLLGTLSLGARGQRNETNITLSRSVARGIESRRHMIGRSIERHIAKAIYEHPKNQDKFEAGGKPPSLVYVPRNVSLDIDAAFVQAILQLRQRNELSRESILEYLGFDQSIEAQRREYEDDFFDDIFNTFTPFDSPEHQGGEGGRPVGGGESPNNGQPSNRTSNGNKSTGGE